MDQYQYLNPYVHKSARWSHRKEDRHNLSEVSRFLFIPFYIRRLDTFVFPHPNPYISKVMQHFRACMGYLLPSPCTAFSQSLSVNSFQWRIRDERAGNIFAWTTWPETLCVTCGVLQSFPWCCFMKHTWSQGWYMESYITYNHDVSLTRT